MKTIVLILNLLGFNFVSRFITGHIFTGILVLLNDIITITTLSSGIGVIFLVIGIIIWVVDLVTVCSNKWKSNGVLLINWGFNIDNSFKNKTNKDNNQNNEESNNRVTTNENKIKCPMCDNDIKLGSKFCSKCGSPLFKICNKCNSENSIDSKFCYECGNIIE